MEESTGLRTAMIEPRTIRQSIRESLWALGASPTAAMTESLLIRDGVYCGQRFQNDGYEAVWFIEENQVKFYGRSGGVLLACDVQALPVVHEAHEARRAA